MHSTCMAHSRPRPGQARPGTGRTGGELRQIRQLGSFTATFVLFFSLSPTGIAIRQTQTEKKKKKQIKNLLLLLLLLLTHEIIYLNFTARSYRILRCRRVLYSTYIYVYIHTDGVGTVPRLPWQVLCCTQGSEQAQLRSSYGAFFLRQLHSANRFDLINNYCFLKRFNPRILTNKIVGGMYVYTLHTLSGSSSYIIYLIRVRIRTQHPWICCASKVPVGEKVIRSTDEISSCGGLFNYN